MHRLVPAAPAGKLRHSAALGTETSGGLTEGKRGTPLAPQGGDGPCKPHAQSAQPLSAPAMLERCLKSSPR